MRLAAHAAFGKTTGQGKGKSKKGKGKGTLEHRRDKLKSLKAKSTCMRCGTLGHWVGDPECKVSTSQGGKGKAHQQMKDSVSLQEMSQQAAFMVRPKSAAAESAAAHSSAAVHEPKDMVMEGGDKKFYMGQHRNETYSEVAKKVVHWPRVICPCRIRTSLLGSIGTTLSKMEVCTSGHPWGYLREPMYLDQGKRGLGRPDIIHL